MTLHRRQMLAQTALALGAGRAARAAPSCTPDPPGLIAPPKVAVSLRALQDDLTTRGPSAGPRDPVFSVYGMTRVDGYVADAENRDIVLLGQADNTAPALDIDDLAVSLRALLLRYARREGNTLIYSYPGISIDPIPETLRRLDEIGRAIAAAPDIQHTEAIIAQWREICVSDQAVRVIGVPAASHFAAVMLDADYRLKMIADGESRTPAGIESIDDETLRQAIDAAKLNRPHPLSSYNRFWFVAGRCVQSSGLTTTILDRCEVALATEQERTSASGDRSGTGRRDPVASRFACDISRLYPAIASGDPTYRGLEALYRWMAIARLMVDRNIAETAGLDLTVLTDRHRLAEYDVRETVQGRFSLGSSDFRSGSVMHYLRLPSCGGVELGFPKGKVEPGRLHAAAADPWGRRALAARTSPTATHWPIA